MFHGQHLKETEEILIHLMRNHRNKCTQTHIYQKKKKKCSPLRPYKIRNTPTRHIAQNKHSPKCSHWFMQMQTLAGRSVHPKSHTKRERRKTHHTQTVGSCYTLFIVTVSLGSSGFFFLFAGRYLLDSASVYALPFASHLVLSLGPGVLPPWCPRSLSQVGLSPGVGVGQAGLDPAPRGWLFLSPISIAVGVRPLASSGGRKAAGETSKSLGSSSASPVHLLHDSRERPYPLWASVFLSVNQMLLHLQRVRFSLCCSGH